MAGYTFAGQPHLPLRYERAGSKSVTMRRDYRVSLPMTLQNFVIPCVAGVLFKETEIVNIQIVLMAVKVRLD